MTALKDLVLLWKTADDPAAFQIESRARMIASKKRGERMHRDYAYSAGAVYAEWNEATDDGRLLQLFAELVTIVERDGVPFEIMHRALLDVPEYASMVEKG